MSSGSDTSSKRFNGTIGFLLIQLIILFVSVMDLVKDFELSELVASLLKFDLSISAALLGIAIFDKVKKEQK